MDHDPDLLLGFETHDDAAVFRLSENLAAVLTADFLTPIVDDPYQFGRIAAANALSDIYAMGAEPKIALNLLAIDSTLGTEVAREILRGGTDAVREAGATIAGGHTIDDTEPKYGLSVFGTVCPDEIIFNSGAKPKDLLYLTKALGSGIKSCAFRINEETEESMRPVIESMMELNANAARAMKESGAHAATDITGFGLAGHLYEMLKASGCSALLDWDAIPLFDGVWEYSVRRCRTGRGSVILDYVEGFFERGALSETEYDNRMGVLCDPQTSGGLLIAIPAERRDVFEACFEMLYGRPISPIGIVTPGSPGNMGFQT